MTGPAGSVFAEAFRREVQRVAEYAKTEAAGTVFSEKGLRERGHSEEPTVVVAQWARANQEACRKNLKKHRKKGRRNEEEGEGGESGTGRWGRGFDDQEYEVLIKESYETLKESYEAALKASGYRCPSDSGSVVLRALGAFLFLSGAVIVGLALAKDASATRTLLAMSVSGALLLAWSNGANDAANSMGGAVGAGSLTLRQAVIGGAVAELAGAALMGVHVSKTISKGVIQATDYLGSPEEFAFLFFAVTVGTACTTIAATYYKLPISATHGIIGGLIGCGALARGGASLGTRATVRTCLSWVLSPALGGFITGVLHCIVHFAVFRNAASGAAAARRSVKLQPFFSALAAFIVALFLLLKGPKELYFWKKGTYGIPFLTALGIGALGGASNLLWARREAARGGSDEKENELCEVDPSNPRSSFASNQSVPSEAPADPLAAEQEPAGAPVLAGAEKPFSMLLVVTSLCVAFAHGANDVGNSAGLFAAVLEGVAGRVVATPDVPILVVIPGALAWAWGSSPGGSAPSAPSPTRSPRSPPRRPSPSSSARRWLSSRPPSWSSPSAPPTASWVPSSARASPTRPSPCRAPSTGRCSARSASPGSSPSPSPWPSPAPSSPPAAAPSTARGRRARRGGAKGGAAAAPLSDRRARPARRAPPLPRPDPPPHSGGPTRYRLVI